MAVSLAELPEFIARAEEVAATLGEGAQAVPIDVREPATIQAAVEWTVERCTADTDGLRVHARLTSLSEARLRALRRMGWHYLVAARK